MKSTKHILLTLCLICAMLASCKQIDDITKNPNQDETIVEGAPSTIGLSFKSSEMGVHSRAGLDKEKEEEIKSIAVFIFDSTGVLISQTIHENAGAHSSSGDSILRPNEIDKINIETFAGYKRDLYVVANYHSNSIEGLRSVTTKPELERLVITMLGNPMLREFGLCKIGAVNKTNITNNTNVLVDLKYSSAKITIRIINKCPELNVTGWTSDGLPMKSYAIERQANPSDPTYHDAVDVRNSTDFYYDFSDQNFEFDSMPSSSGFGSVNDPKRYTSTFYMYENRRGGRALKSPPPGWTEQNPSTDYKLKAWYAPSHATRIRIWGQTSQNGYDNSFVLNHYLGANNSNDYNVARATHYTYTITINSLNNINIDTNIEQSELILEVRPPADLTSIDAHYSTRPFMLHTNLITDPTASITAEVLESSSSDIRPDWLDLSTTAIAGQHIRKNSDQQISAWQQEGADNTYIRPRHIPNKATRAKITYTPPSGIQFPSEDYPDDDTSLPYSKGHHRLCKELTDIPTAAIMPTLKTPVAIYLNIDEFPYSASATYREAVVRFTVNRPAQEPQYKRYVIRQYPAHAFTDAPDKSGAMLVVERVEEYEHTTHAYMPMQLQMTAGMQWGPYSLPLSIEQTNGYNNTLLGVYKEIASPSYYEGTNYISPKYGSLSGGWSMAQTGVIKEGAGVSIPMMGAPFYNLPRQDYNNALNNTYNTTAARYCHEKNRDLNGDGNIDASETHWYLPAVGETQLFWTYRDVINVKGDFYWTSTEATSATAYAVSMLHETAAPHLIFCGVPQPLKKEFINTIGPPRVRCVRKIDHINLASIQPIISHRSDGTTVVDCSNLPGTMYTTTSKNNINQSNNGAILAANREVFKKFEVQKTANPLTDYNSIHFGNGKCDKTLGWRLPTQREMLVIFSVRADLEANGGFTPFNDTYYWTMSRDLNSHYLVDFSSGLSIHGTYFDPSNKFHFRCVRELP